MLTKIITTAIAVVCLAGGTSAYFDFCYYSDTTCTTKIQCMTMVEENAAVKKDNVAHQVAFATHSAAEIAEWKAQGVDTSNMIVQSMSSDDDDGVIANITSCEEYFTYANNNNDMYDDDEPPITKSVFELCEDHSPKANCKSECKMHCKMSAEFNNAAPPCDCDKQCGEGANFVSRSSQIPGTPTVYEWSSAPSGGVVYNSMIKVCTGSTAAKGDGVVKMETSAASNLIPANSKMFKMDDVSNIKAGDELTFGSGTKAEEKGTVKAVEKTRRSRRAATPGTVTLREALKNEHVAGTAITWTPAAVPKSSAVTTTVGVGIFAIVAALF